MIYTNENVFRKFITVYNEYILITLITVSGPEFIPQQCKTKIQKTKMTKAKVYCFPPFMHFFPSLEVIILVTFLFISAVSRYLL